MVIGNLISDPAIQAWAIASVVVGLKTLAAGMYTSSIRIRKQIYISPEDFEMQGQAVSDVRDPDIERARRIHQNDLEAGVPFALIGLVYALTEPSQAGLWICFAGFPLARIAHSIAYARSMMPLRTIVWSVGFGILVWMAISSLISLLG